MWPMIFPHVSSQLLSWLNHISPHLLPDNKLALFYCDVTCDIYPHLLLAIKLTIYYFNVTNDMFSYPSQLLTWLCNILISLKIFHHISLSTIIISLSYFIFTNDIYPRLLLVINLAIYYFNVTNDISLYLFPAIY